MMVLDWLMELLYPRKCVLCGGILSADQTDLCHDCRTTDSLWHLTGRKLPLLDDHTAVWFYEDQVRDSLLRFKFSGKRHYAGSYGRFLGMQVQRNLPDMDLITWVPVSAFRRWRRGYDQAELLAKAVASEMSVPAFPTLRKRRNNPAQSGISDPTERRRNVKDAYRVVSRQNLAGKRILLVDDILTTGATSCECARCLREAGAETIFLAVMATGRERR